MNSKEIARLACEAMEDKKAQDIKIINIEHSHPATQQT